MRMMTDVNMCVVRRAAYKTRQWQINYGAITANNLINIIRTMVEIVLLVFSLFQSPPYHWFTYNVTCSYVEITALITDSCSTTSLHSKGTSRQARHLDNTMTPATRPRENGMSSTHFDHVF